MDGWLGRLADLVAQAPAHQQLGLVFLGGLLTSANPCVLVAAPLVVGFTGGTKEGRHHPMVPVCSVPLPWGRSQEPSLRPVRRPPWRQC